MDALFAHVNVPFWDCTQYSYENRLMWFSNNFSQFVKIVSRVDLLLPGWFWDGLNCDLFNPIKISSWKIKFREISSLRWRGMIQWRSRFKSGLWVQMNFSCLLKFKIESFPSIFMVSFFRGKWENYEIHILNKNFCGHINRVQEWANRSGITSN